MSTAPALFARRQGARRRRKAAALAARGAAGLAAPALFVGALACGGDGLEDLGEHPDDNVALADSPALAHLAAAIDGGEQLTLVDVLRGEDELFSRPPDPSALLELQRADQDALPPLEDGVPLRVLSYNVGLLQRWYPFTVIEVPEIEHRRARAPELLLAGDWDILLLQEVWEGADVDRFAAVAEDRGYALYAGAGRSSHERHGLLMLIRGDLIDSTKEQVQKDTPFRSQRGIEEFPGPGVVRSFLSWEFTLAGGGPRVRLYDVHTTAFPDFWRERAGQVRQLALDSREAGEETVVLVGGDLNAGPYYPVDAFGSSAADDDALVDGWWGNAVMYAAILHYGGFRDVQLLAGRIDDKAGMDALPPFSPGPYHQDPLGAPGSCDALPSGLFSATDCNSLYFRQYAGQEYPARIDYLLFRDSLERVRVVDAALEYTAPLDFGAAGRFELSDHYAVGATLRLGAAP
ncbi:MAG: endonuclease/exonuclease/phosphatase family protein [Myxococcales bacterium]|nr:endonuclease/exonuclease/phosphatase family protein [Myxococcales bacterium]